MRKIKRFSQLKEDNYYFWNEKGGKEQELIYLVIQVSKDNSVVKDKTILSKEDGKWKLLMGDQTEKYTKKEFTKDFINEWNIFKLNSKEVEEFKQKIMLLKL